MAAAGALMLFVPFIWWGGADGFRLWLANAAANAADLVTFSAWSPVQFDRSLLLLTGRTIDEVRALGCVWSRRAAVLLGAAAVFGAMWRVFRVERSSRDYPTVMLLLAALVWLPGNMLCYTGAYFVPAAALWWRDASEGRRGLRFWAELAAWCAIWCMLQVPLGTGTANRTVACLAWHALVLMAAVPVRSAGPVPSAV